MQRRIVQSAAMRQAIARQTALTRHAVVPQEHGRTVGCLASRAATSIVRPRLVEISSDRRSRGLSYRAIPGRAYFSTTPRSWGPAETTRSEGAKEPGRPTPITEPSSGASSSKIAGDNAKKPKVTASVASLPINGADVGQTNRTAVAEKASPKAGAVAKAPKKPLSTRIMDEVRHYWSGTKLLVAETRISFRLMLRLMRGAELTRRENRQLRRTAADLFRLIPMSVFLLVPFMEFALPIVLKFFPNMLPSTFESKSQSDEKRKRLLKVRLEMASFLKDTLKEMSSSKDKHGSTQLKEYFARTRKLAAIGREDVSEDDVTVRVAQCFEDEMTLDHLSRPQLVSMCRYMGITSFGTDHFLRYQISNKAKLILADDKVINSEGIDTLTLTELQRACQERGIKVSGSSPARLRAELQQWIKLHLAYRISSPILILSRAFMLLEEHKSPSPETGISQATMTALKTTLQSLPESLIHEASMKGEDDAADKLEVIRREEAEIQEEKLAEDRRLEEEEEAREAEEQEAATGAVIEEAQETAAEFVKAAPEAIESELSTAQAEHIAETVLQDPKIARSDEITGEQFQELSEVIKVLSSKSAAEGTDVSKTEVEASKAARDTLERAQTESEPGQTAAPPTEAPEEMNRGSKRLQNRLLKMCDRIMSDMDVNVPSLGAHLRSIKVHDGSAILVRDLAQVLRSIGVESEELISRTIDNLDKNKDGLVDLDEVALICESTLREKIAEERAQKAEKEEGTKRSTKSEKATEDPDKASMK